MRPAAEPILAPRDRMTALGSRPNGLAVTVPAATAWALCKPASRRAPEKLLIGQKSRRAAPVVLLSMSFPLPSSRTVEPTVDLLEQPLSEVDPEIAEALRLELERQHRTLEMIASENFVPMSVLECHGSVLTNKYAVGYPGRREYGGCEYIDIVEQLAIDRALDLFDAEHANVQPYSGAQANTAVFQALLEPGDTMLGLEVTHGGHLTHGTPLHISGRMYNLAAYHVDRRTGLVDMEEVERLARQRRPRMILAGWSSYPRVLDFAHFRAIADEVGAYLLVDMAHFAGLVAAGVHPNPVPYADVVTTTIHKTLGGPRGGMILCAERLASRIDAAVYPGQQGGPLQHVVAAKAVALKIAGSDAFRERQERTVCGAQAVARQLLSAGRGVSVLTGGTDVHLVMCDLRESALNGMEAEERLASIGITVNRTAVPFDPRLPAACSGLRIGTPALATRGLQVEDFVEVGSIIAESLVAVGFEERRAELARRTRAIADRFPLYSRLRGGESGGRRLAVVTFDPGVAPDQDGFEQPLKIAHGRSR
jgi:glycine hydroxymethyltransferase